MFICIFEKKFGQGKKIVNNWKIMLLKNSDCEILWNFEGYGNNVNAFGNSETELDKMFHDISNIYNTLHDVQNITNFHLEHPVML